MKSRLTYILSGLAVAFAATLLIVVLSSGTASTGSNTQDADMPMPSSMDASDIGITTPASLAPEYSVVTGAGDVPIAAQKGEMTREELEAAMRQLRLKRAEEEGRLEEYLAKEQLAIEEKEEKTRIREERKRRNREYSKAMQEYHEKAREAREAGLERPEKPRRNAIMSREEKLKAREIRIQERIKRHEEQKESKEAMESLIKNQK